MNRARLRCGLAAVALSTLTGLPMPPTSQARTVPSVSAAALQPALTPVVATSITPVSVEPTVATPGVEVTMTTSVSVPAGTDLQAARVVVTAHDSPRDRAQVTEWATTTGPANGRVLAQAAVSGSAGDAASAATTATTTTATTTTVRVTIPASAIADSSPFRVIPVSVGLHTAGSADPVASAHTFLVWHQRKEYEPLAVSTVLPVTVPPQAALFAADATARSQAWSAALGAQSVARRVLLGSQNHEVTLAVDPFLLHPFLTTGTITTTTPTDDATTDDDTTDDTTDDDTPTTTPAQPDTTPTPGATTPTAPPSTAASGTPAPSATPEQLAADAGVTALAAQLRAALEGRTVWALPFGDLDIAAVASADPTASTAAGSIVGDLMRQTTVLSEDLGQPVRTDVAWPVGGTWDDGLRQALGRMWADGLGTTLKAVMVSNAAITPDGAYTPSARRTTADEDLVLLGIDPVLSATLPLHTPVSPGKGVNPPSPGQSTQRLLADTMTLLNERSGTPRSVLIAPGRTYDPDPAALDQALAALEHAPWLTVQPAEALLTPSSTERNPRTVGEPGTSAAGAPTPPPATLTTARLGEVRTAHEELANVATVLADGSDFEHRFGTVLDQLASARWRWAPGEWAGLLTTVQQRASGATQAVAVLGRRLNFFAERGVLQVTVSNGLDYAITGVRLVLEPTNPRIQVLDPPEPLTIGARSQTVVNVEAAAVAVGPADIRAYLTTADGTRIGQGAVISIEANPLDRTIYTVGGVVVGLIVLFGVVRSLRRGSPRAVPDEAAQD